MAEKTERFGLALSPKDKRLLEKLARERGESRALIMRELIRQAASKYNMTGGDYDATETIGPR